MWSVYADPLKSLPDPDVFCPVSIGRDIELWGIRSWIVFYNLPTFDQLRLAVFSDLNGKPGQKLYESSPYALEQIQDGTANSSVKEVYFEFPRPPHLKASGFYHLSLTGDGYLFEADSFIAHKKAWPDPCYESGADLEDGRILAKLPYDVALIGREL